MTRALLGAIALAVVSCGGARAPETPTPAAASPCHAPASKQSPPPAAPPPAPSSADASLENLTITGLAVKGNRTVSVERLTQISGLAVGAAYHRAAIAKAIAMLYHAGELDDVQVLAAPTDGGVAVELLVRERPFVDGIFAPGATPEEAAALANRLGLAQGRRLDVAELHLRMQGSEAPNVDFEIIPKRDNKADVCLYRK